MYHFKKKIMEQLINLKEIMPTKSNIELVASQIIQPLEDGDMNKLEFIVKMKFIEEVIKTTLKKVEISISRQESVYGAKIEPAETGVKYNYSQSEKWCGISEKIKPLSDELKSIEEQIKIATKIGKSFVDETTGEIISPVEKTSISGYKVTLAK